MGIIAIPKVGYNVFVLGGLLLIFDTEGGHKQAAELRIIKSRFRKELALGW